MPGSEFGDTSHTEYQTGNQGQNDVNFDLTADNWQMHNLWKTGDKDVQSRLSEKLHGWFNCRGDECM